MHTLDEIKQMIYNIGSEGYKDGSSTKKGWTYHTIPFEEFSCPTHKSSTVEEYNCVKSDYGSFENKLALDIGCANGYFSFNIAKDGARKIIGYEGDKLVCDVNNAIKEYKNINNVEFVNKYFNMSDAESFDQKFDIVIMLNIHMWIHKQLGAEKTKGLMRELCKKCWVMYFQTAHKGGGGGYQVPEFTKAKHIKKYLEEVGFKRVECINQNMEWFKRFMFRCSNV